MLAVLIILAAYIAFFKKGNDETKNDEVVTPTDQVQTNSFKVYTTSWGSFSYKSPATIIPNNHGVIEVGTGVNDPYTESIVHYENVASMPAHMGQDSPITTVTFGNNVFQTYEKGESGTRIYILNSGNGGAAFISIPYRSGGNSTNLYIDLASVKQN